ncbi:MAG: phosphotransferase, partial [bacterium]
MGRFPGHELCTAFDLGVLITIEPAGGTRNRNLVVETDRGQWFVRQRYPGYCDVQRVWFDHQAAQFLADQGVPVVAPRTARDGNSFWRDGENIWEVYPFVEGRHFHDGREEDVAALARSVAAFHRAGRTFPLRYEKAAPRGETDPDR